MWIRSFDKFERVGEERVYLYNYHKRAEWKCLFDSQPIAVTHKWFTIFFSKIMSGMEHRLTDSNLIISRSDLNALKNVLVDKIHEKSTLIVQSMMVSINFGPDITKYTFYVNTNTTLNICLDFFISFSLLFPLIYHFWVP